jgi:hypothetical protein
MRIEKQETPYGTIFRSGDRLLFAGSEEQLRAAKAWEFFANPENADKSSLAREAALAAERDEDEARALPLPEAD